MTPDRRTFLSAAAGAAGLSALRRGGPEDTPPLAPRTLPTGLDPWIEVDSDALRANASACGALAGGRPVLAVVKNNGYGSGTAEVARALDGHPSVAGFAVVKVAEAVELGEAGLATPVLHMGTATDEESTAIAALGVRLSAFRDDDPARARRFAAALGRPLPVHVYVDTGMRRLGVPSHRALPFLEELARAPVRVEGTYMGFTEDDDFDAEQLRRFRELAASAIRAGVGLGALHAASSHALFLRPAALLDMVRPGLALYGAYPSGSDRTRAALRPAFRLRARVARVERLLAGDSVSYGRNWVAERPTWTATLPVGHADGYPRRAVDGCEVLIGARTYPVVGAVSASHTIVVLGDEPAAAVGDVATLVGADHPAIHPNEVARRAGVSVYDVLMHLGQKLPRVVV